jgi:AhpD family alkylhydroperoxidase
MILALARPGPQEARKTADKEISHMGATQDTMSKINQHLGQFGKETGEFLKKFQEMIGAAHKNGTIDEKTVELIMIGIAVAKQCSYCIDFHVNNALKAGCTRGEILAASACAVAMGGGPALMYTHHVVEVLDELGQ